MSSRTRTQKSRQGNPGSQGALRQLNQQRIVESLGGGPATQAELSRITGLSTATVSNIVKDMELRGLVETTPTTSSGRRALSVRLTDSGHVAIGLDFGRRHLRVVVASVAYDIVAEEAIELPLGYAAEYALDEAAALVDKLLGANGVDRGSVLGVGVGIPGPIDRRTETVLLGAILPEWVGVSRHTIEDRLGLPVTIDNDANLGAFAEVVWGRHRGVKNLVFVKIGSGIGAGIVIHGMPYYGGFGITGEIGHAPVNDGGRVCRCGNRGCLETVASTSMMIEELSRGLPTPITTADIVRRGLQRDPATIRVLDDAGTAIGRSLATVANVISPEVIVIGGPLADLGDVVLDPIRRGILRNALPLLGDAISLQMSDLGDRAEALGAVSLVLQQRRAHAA
jgi:predicted NBD/HSP70 family sugar kinase